MKEDVKSFEELGNLIGLCLDNFENVILPKLPRRQGKEISNDVESKKIPPKSFLAIDFQESSDEKKLLRDFVQAKTGKETAEKEVYFENLFDHCLESYEKLEQVSVLNNTKEKTLKGSSDDKPNLKEIRRSLSRNVLEKNFRLHLKSELEKKKADEGQAEKVWETNFAFTQHFENKQHKTDNKNKDLAVNTQKENTITNVEPRLGSLKKKQLERSLPRKRLLGQ